MRGILIAAVALALVVGGCGTTTGSKPVTVTVTAPSAVATASDEPTAAPAPPPIPADFAVDITITEQKCYGSAGCNYELNVNPRYVGSSAATLGRDWLVVYEINGGDDPQMGNFRLEGDNIRWDEKKTISGSAGAEFTATVTQVIEQH
jgi:hypothetical protein